MPSRQLTVVVSDGGPGGPPPMIFVNDGVPGPGSPWFPAPLPIPPGSSPDVTIGNDQLMPGNYIAAVVALMPSSTGGDVFLFLHHVVNVGTGGLAITPPYAIFNLSGTGTVTGAPHIDIVARYSTPYPGAGGLPFSNTFAVTWKDVTGIMGYYASLNAPFPGTTMVINPNPNMSSPDVAAVERFNASIPGFEDRGLFSYIDATVSPNIMYYTEWRMSPLGPVTVPTVYDNTLNYIGIFSPSISTQRIDAIDDWTQIMPGVATFDIVASAQTAGGAHIVEYNDNTGPGVATNITAGVIGLGPKNLLPVVACGPGPFYSVGYVDFPNQNYYVTSVDWSTGMPTTDPNAYQIGRAHV